MRSKTNFGATLVEHATLFGFELTGDETSLFAKLGDESTSGTACEE